MASVKQCDRCGAIIKYSERSDNLERQWWRYLIRRDAYPYPQIDDIDLCVDCLRSLYNWLMEGEKRK